MRYRWANLGLLLPHLLSLPATSRILLTCWTIQWSKVLNWTRYSIGYHIWLGYLNNICLSNIRAWLRPMKGWKAKTKKWQNTWKNLYMKWRKWPMNTAKWNSWYNILTVLWTSWGKRRSNTGSRSVTILVFISKSHGLVLINGILQFPTQPLGSYTLAASSYTL